MQLTHLTWAFSVEQWLAIVSGIAIPLLGGSAIVVRLVLKQADVYLRAVIREANNEQLGKINSTYVRQKVCDAIHGRIERDAKDGNKAVLTDAYLRKYADEHGTGED